MRERAANCGRARLWLCSPSGRRRLLSASPIWPQTHRLGLPARLGGRTDRHLYIVIQDPAATAFPAASEPAAGLNTGEETEAQRGP